MTCSASSERLRTTSPPPDVEALIGALVRDVDQRLAGQEYVLTCVDPTGTYEPVSINAPVFDHYGDVDLVICLVDFPEQVSGRDVVRFGETVRRRAEELTAAAGGAPPTTWPHR